jgi:hypothetical protein
MSQHTDLGHWGESFIASLLHQATGIQALSGRQADLNFGGTEIEVKTAKPSNFNGDGAQGYQFCITREGHTQLKAPLLILVCVRPWDPENPEVFVIPAKYVRPKLRKIGLPLDTTRYRGTWANFRWALHLIADYCDAAI